MVTVGALVSMAAHLDGMASSQLDFMGFAQKGGAVLAFIRWAKRPDLLNQVRIDTQQADLLLACDLVVGASADALQTVRHGRTRIISSEHQNPTDKFVRDPDANLHADALLEKMRFAAGSEAMESIDAYDLSLRLLGDSIGANILLLGYAWQRALVPVSLVAIERAIELNGVAIEMNRMAFHLGRPPRRSPIWCSRWPTNLQGRAMTLEALIAHREAHLTDYQGCRLCRALPQAGGHGARSRTAGRRRGRSARPYRGGRLRLRQTARLQGRVRSGPGCSRRPLRAATWRDLRRQSAPHLPHGPATARPPGCHGASPQDRTRPLADVGNEAAGEGQTFAWKLARRLRPQRRAGMERELAAAYPRLIEAPAGEAGSRQPGRRDRARRAAARCAASVMSSRPACARWRRAKPRWWVNSPRAGILDGLGETPARTPEWGPQRIPVVTGK